MEVSPNTARIIDYWLGGSHYFPIDVEAALSAKPIEASEPIFLYGCVVYK